MNVIFNTADLQGRHIVGARDATNKCPDALFNVRCEPRFADATTGLLTRDPGLKRAGLKSFVALRRKSRLRARTCSTIHTVRRVKEFALIIGRSNRLWITRGNECASHTVRTMSALPARDPRHIPAQIPPFS